MQHWNLERQAGAGGRTGPQVLFSTPEARTVIVDLAPGEVMGDHRVRERAIVQVLDGRVEFVVADVTTACAADTLLLLEPGERHSVRALDRSRLLLTLAPWPAPDHYAPDEQEDPHELPVNATRPALTRP